MTVVQCNYKLGTQVHSPGATAYLTYGVDSASKRVRILAQNKTGQWVLRWESIKRLCNFRASEIPIDANFCKNVSHIARDHWTPEIIVNLNQLAGKEKP